VISADERQIFGEFCTASPNFAGRELKFSDGADPPDFVGVDEKGARIGIELGEWLNPQQMAASIKRERDRKRVS
jgi:hypothetical protein